MTQIHWTAEIGELRPKLLPTMEAQRVARKAKREARDRQLREMRENYHREMAKVMSGGRASWECT